MGRFIFEKPQFTDKTPEEKLKQVEDYLWRLTEELEHLPDEAVNGTASGDAVIEQGYIKNGFYRKWKNGTVECWLSKDFVIDSANKYSADYPSLFITPPRVQATLETGDGTNDHSLCLVAYGKGTTVSTPAYRVYAPYYNLSVEGQKITIHFYCIGRWQ